jgi:DNA-binding NarL/FixJ family response regulator
LLLCALAGRTEGPEHNEGKRRMNKIRIVLADEHPAIIHGLQDWFDGHARYRVVAAARDAAHLFEALEVAACELIVAEAPAIGGDHPLLSELRRRHPDTPAIAYTAHTDPQMLRGMLDAGAAAVVSKRDDLRELERICGRVMSGARGIVSKLAAASGSAPASAPFDAPASFDASTPYRGVRVSVKLSDAAE